MMVNSLLVLAVAVQANWVLTPGGLGPVRIGMTRAQVAKALHAPLSGTAIESDDICVEKEARGYPGLTFLFEDGRLGRVSVSKPSRIKTGRGIGAGATAQQIKRAYGTRLKAEKNIYEAAPAQYLTYWTVPEKRGILFETGKDRRAYVIHAGTGSIAYAEGCA